MSIPASSRVIVRARDEHRCVVCGMRGLHWHHRRSRSVVDDCTHAPCNGVTLCKSDHDWVHANPFEARSLGLIISRTALPDETPVFTNQRGWLLLDHKGGWHSADQPV